MPKNDPLGGVEIRFTADNRDFLKETKRIRREMRELRKAFGDSAKRIRADYKKLADGQAAADFTRQSKKMADGAKKVAAESKKVADGAKKVASENRRVSSTTSRATMRAKELTRALSRQEKQLARQQKAYRDTRTRLQLFTSGLGRVATQIRNLRTLRYGITAIFGAVAGGFGAAALIGRQARLNDELARSARLMGGNIRDFQRYAQVGRILGSDFRDVSDAVLDLNESLNEARINLGGYADAWNRLGVDFNNISRRPNEQLREVSSTIARNIREGVYDRGTAIQGLREAGLNEQRVLAVVTEWEALEEQLKTWTTASAAAVEATAEVRQGFLNFLNELEVGLTEAIARNKDRFLELAEFLTNQTPNIISAIQVLVASLGWASRAAVSLAEWLGFESRASSPELREQLSALTGMTREELLKERQRVLSRQASDRDAQANLRGGFSAQPGDSIFNPYRFIGDLGRMVQGTDAQDDRTLGRSQPIHQGLEHSLGGYPKSPDPSPKA